MSAKKSSVSPLMKPGMTKYGQICCLRCNEPPIGVTGLCLKHQEGAANQQQQQAAAASVKLPPGFQGPPAMPGAPDRDKQ